MSALDDIEAAAGALNALTAQETAEKARIDAAVAAALAAIIAPQKAIYLDAVAGLDTNDGSSAVKAVATPQRAAALIGAGQYGVVFLLSDVALTAPLQVLGNLIFLSAGTQAGVTPTATIRKITIQPSAVTTNPAPIPNYAVAFGPGGTLTFFAVNLSIGPITAATGTFGTRDSLHFWSSSIVFDPAMTSPLIAPSPGATVMFDAVTLPSGYGGKIFSGVAAGGNANSPSLRTNLLSA